MISFGKVLAHMKSQFTFLFPQIHFLPKTRIKNPVLLTVGLAPRYRHLFAATVGLASTFQVRRRWRKHIGSVFSSATAFYDPHRHFGEFNSLWFLQC